LKAIGLLPFQNAIYDAAAVIGELKRAITDLGLVGIAVSCQGLKEHLGFADLVADLRGCSSLFAIRTLRQRTILRNP
jgi:hypothetical protein